ncbi:MAG TPA: hypothetical protein P5175_10160 [Anaerohalosphaeraceae bacterium]|nr:hypothetical protein [Anaerohalosphaeraceae bacterium]
MPFLNRTIQKELNYDNDDTPQLHRDSNYPASSPHTAHLPLPKKTAANNLADLFAMFPQHNRTEGKAPKKQGFPSDQSF